MYLLVCEGEHYNFVPGDAHDQQWFVEITFGKYEGVVLSFGDVKLDTATGAINYNMDMKDATEEDHSLYDDELQLIASSIMQDILLNSVSERTGRFIDIETGEVIGY